MRNLMFALAATVVLAATASSAAYASSATTSGVPTPVGTQFTTTGGDLAMKSNLLGTITCSTLTLKGEITKNSAGTVEAAGANTSPTQTGCKNGEKAVSITRFDITKLLTTTSGSGTWSFKMVTDVGSLTCTYTGSNVPFSYTPGASSIQFSEASGVTGSPASCGSTKISTSFSLESGTSTPLVLD
jgi:hypothetical protein